ncbi:hypothetical protein M422DRAFT_251023 [Sphaerobolus stellatus SS14]|uniref:Small-subunit processome Utp12 domain-containing protein n=1 Tax=Sphaerobolus stellatus (strain SS14) TaxID=990650 RepID=A0A0C9VT46_SPHS4|nr:hypothetical protein M422DRAFT_251023 [Sphaerobolus stellatus SS14]
MSAKKKSHAQSTAALSHPQVHDAASLTAQALFSPDASLFALLAQAVDKHRIRVFDATTASPVVEHTLDTRATSTQWLNLALVVEEEKSGAPTKKRKKEWNAALAAVEENPLALLCVGLVNGSVAIFSAKHARIVRTLTHPSSLTPIHALSAGARPSQLWSSSSDGTLRLWNVVTNELLGSWKAEGVPYSALAPRPGHVSNDETQLLVANHAVRLLSFRTSKSVSETEKPSEKASFTGHASNVNSLDWDKAHPTRFVSTATGDRVVNLWRAPEAPSTQGSVAANIPLDSVVRHASISSTDARSTLLTLSASGKVSLFELPPDTKSPAKVPTLSPRSTITAPSRKGEEDVQVVAATFLLQEGRVRVARLKGGLKPIFDDVQYIDDAGNFISKTTLTKDVSAALAAAAEATKGVVQRRYVEARTTVGSGIHLGLDKDDFPTTVEGELDVDLAELSLGQRMTALSGGDNAMEVDDDESGSDSGQKSKPRGKSRSGKEKDESSLRIPANSLARTLVQALHSSDTGLLETCLLHTDEKIIMNTVRRLPPQLAVPLLNACVDRLGRGPRANQGKATGGGASSQRGTGLVKWVRAVLVVHTAYLMTLPDLVTRLSGLHATITARLALRDPLLALSGRLDMVLTQIELRASGGPTPLAAEGKRAKKAKREPTKYVEGETSESEDEMEIEIGDDAGSVEDVELGGESGSDEDDEGSEEDDEEEEEEEEEEDSDEDGPHLNGFVDDEAEEDWGDESDEFSDDV